MVINKRSFENLALRGGAIGLAFGIGVGLLCWAGNQFHQPDPFPSTNNKPVHDNAPTFDPDGRDADGWDHLGYDAEGYHRNGYNREGYNRDGFDFEGFAKNKYNAQGIDRAGKDEHYYISYFWKLYNLKEEAFKQMQAGEYAYALLDARLILEQSISLVICHALGPETLGDTLVQNLKICEANQLLGEDPEFMNRLHGVRKICNPNLHTLDSADHVTINQVYFAVAQVRDLIPVARDAVSA